MEVGTYVILESSGRAMTFHMSMYSGASVYGHLTSTVTSLERSPCSVPNDIGQ